MVLPQRYFRPSRRKRVIAVSLGGTVPLMLKRLGVDPALASGPILTTVTDMVGFFLALTFTSVMLNFGHL